MPSEVDSEGELVEDLQAQRCTALNATSVLIDLPVVKRFLKRQLQEMAF